MTPSPSNPHEQHNGANLPERISGASGTSENNEQRRVLDAEVLEPGQEHDRRNGHAGAFGDQDRHSGRGFGGAEFRRGFGPGGLRFGHIWTSGRMEQNACLAPCITFALFLVCLAQFGLLAGIGFVFFSHCGQRGGQHARHAPADAGPRTQPLALAHRQLAGLFSADRLACRRL